MALAQRLQPAAPPETPAALLAMCPAHAPTPLKLLPQLAHALGVGTVLAKEEGARPLNSFKALGGVYAALRVLSRTTGLPVAALLNPTGRRGALPQLVCASDGNHGLAVAAAARLAGTQALVFLPANASAARLSRIAAQGARIELMAGTYDDAVRAAVMVARDGSALLVADTSSDPTDPVVLDVMAGYGVIADEIRMELAAAGYDPPTHLFVQAGVGGLAAAMASGLHEAMAAPARIVVVEPMGAACVAAALGAGHPVPVPGQLETAAEMLSCGIASASVLALLNRNGVAAMSVPEAGLLSAPAILRGCGGPATTPSGSAGLAGLQVALADPTLRHRFQLGPQSRILLLITEGPLHTDGEGSCK